MPSVLEGPKKAEAAEIPQVVDLDALIREQAKEKGISYDHLYGTLDYESQHFKDVAMQSEVLEASGPNGREDSWGLCQIHLPDHPEITREEAQDPKFCISWMAEQFKEGHADRWTGYRKLYGNK